MYDVAIVGAGPAGATLARLIGKKYKVLLVERRNLDSDHNEYSSGTKCCGGLLAPDAQKMLAQLGLGLPKNVVVGPQLFSVRTIDLQNSLERHYQRFYINIDRGKFDRWLVSLIPVGVDSRFNACFKSLEREEKGYKIRIQQNGKEYLERARLLVGADGAYSGVRRRAFPHHPFPEKYIAVQEWFQSEKPLPYFTTLFDREITDFYCWTIPKENYLIVGAALSPRKNIYHRFDLLKEKLRRYGFVLDTSVRKEGAFILRPKSTGQVCSGTNGIALLGEAAGWISPSSAEGLSYAFRSALACSLSLKNGFDDFSNLYRRNTSGIIKNIMLKNIKSPFMYSTDLRNLIMRSGVLSINIAPVSE